MGRYLIRRLLLLIPTFFLVCFIVFALMRMVPSDAADVIVQKPASNNSAVDRDAVEVMLGLDKPFFTQFFEWILGLLHGDMGDSIFQNGSVSGIIRRQLPVTLELTIFTFILTTVISIPLGLLCAARQERISDNVIRVISVICMSMPVFWPATPIPVYPEVWRNYSPPIMYQSLFEAPPVNLRMFLPPAFLGAITTAGGQLRNVRTLTLEVLRQDYIRTAWAKGVKERVILLVHAFRNTMIPVITQIGGSIGALVGGSVIPETMFNIPGIGRQMTTALANRDYPPVQGCTIVSAVIVMLVNLLVDPAYKWIDPRVKLG